MKFGHSYLSEVVPRRVPQTRSIGSRRGRASRISSSFLLPPSLNHPTMAGDQFSTHKSRLLSALDNSHLLSGSTGHPGGATARVILATPDFSSTYSNIFAPLKRQLDSDEHTNLLASGSGTNAFKRQRMVPGHDSLLSSLGMLLPLAMGSSMKRIFV